MMGNSKQKEIRKDSTTGNSTSSAGSGMQQLTPPPPRVRSAPRDIVTKRKEPLPFNNKRIMEEEHRMYIDPWPVAQKMESRLHWLLERQEINMDGDRDDGYNSADYEEWAAGHHGRIFPMDEDLGQHTWVVERKKEDGAMERAEVFVPFPDHLIQEVEVVEGPNVREEQYSVAEYEEKTSQKRSRHSGNMKVNPAELTTMYQQVSTYIKEKAFTGREVPVVAPPTPAPLPEGIIPIEEETPGMKFMRNRLVEQRRRNLLKRLADDLPPIVEDHEVPQPKGYDSRPVSPLSHAPEPSTIFSFDEEELNEPSS